MESKKRYLPIIAAIIHSVIFGFSFMFTKKGLDSLDPMQLIAFRFLMAALALTLLQVLGIIKVKLKGKNIRMILLVAFFQPLAYYIFEALGVNRTSSSEAGMMIALIPVFVALFGAVFLKEKPTSMQYVFIGLSVLGVVFINVMKGHTESNGNFTGIILLLFAVLCSAAFNISSRKASAQFSPVEITFVMMWVGAITYNIIGISQHIISGNLSIYLKPLANIDVLIPIIYLGIMASVIAFFMTNYTLSKLEASQAAVFTNLSTIVSIIAGVVIMKEDFYWFHLVGAIMILVGVWGTVYYGNKAEN
ncbi:putative permease [Gottschalkia purinilytica]|uniref:Putative permease n=1 Tax=Gottschalkia purinilytica TaxID=1503 RepID=A0A0L0WE83_GOTPU|nr:DMT family transporter [Gottschalkia purinilytica]KNF09746.1 putative permease [Gottschalkia purinilytica]